MVFKLTVLIKNTPTIKIILHIAHNNNLYIINLFELWLAVYDAGNCITIYIYEKP